MKPCLLFGVLLLIAIAKMPGQSSSAHEEDKAKMKAIIQRAMQGDANALMEADSLDPSVAIVSLTSIMHNRAMSPAMVTAANAALQHLPDIENYLGNQIKAFSTQQGSDAAFGRGAAFDALADIHSEKAVAVIAGYLFDDTTPEYRESDFVIDSNKLLALTALAQMHLSGAPTDDRSLMPYAEQILAWRKWAIAKGYVAGRVNSSPAPVTTPIESTPTGIIPRIATPKPTLSPPVPQITVEPKRSFPWLLISILLVVIAVIGYFIQRRRNI